MMAARHRRGLAIAIPLSAIALLAFASDRNNCAFEDVRIAPGCTRSMPIRSCRISRLTFRFLRRQARCRGPSQTVGSPGRRMRQASATLSDGEPRRYLPHQDVDLWRIRIADGRSELVTKDVATGTEQREYVLADAIQWIDVAGFRDEELPGYQLLEGRRTSVTRWKARGIWGRSSTPNRSVSGRPSRAQLQRDRRLLRRRAASPNLCGRHSAEFDALPHRRRCV